MAGWAQALGGVLIAAGLWRVATAASAGAGPGGGGRVTAEGS